MRIGVMVGPEQGDTARKVDRMLKDVEWAEAAGFDTVWVPQIPTDFDALTAIALMSTRTTRIEIGTAVVPLQAQHPVHLVRQALSTHAALNGRLALGVGPSHHWIVQDMLGLPYEKPAKFTRDYLDVLGAIKDLPGSIDVENDTFTVHNPLDIGPVAPMPILVAALGPVMLKIAGERADGTILWMADERAIGEHIVPRITKAAAEAGRPDLGSLRASRCACVRRVKRTLRVSEPTGSWPRPRSRRTTSVCSSRVKRRTSDRWPSSATKKRSSPGSAATATPA